MRPRWIGLPLMAFGGVVLGAACTVSGDPGGVISCSDDGVACYDDTECCSSYCDPGTATCITDAVAPGCLLDNTGCSTGVDCCSGVCDTDGLCGLAICESTGAACTYDSQCCEGEYCTSTGDCGSCEVTGGSCTYDLDCCADACNGDICGG